MRAREVLRPSSEHDLICTAYLPAKTPYTCSLDGIQCSSGCTLGKLSIKLIDGSSEDMKFIFEDRRDGRKLEVRIRKGVAGRIEEVSAAEGMDEAARSVEEEDLWNLLEERQYL